ncbi:MAG: hypothetical protein R3F43_09220 [bacterium]
MSTWGEDCAGAPVRRGRAVGRPSWCTGRSWPRPTEPASSCRGPSPSCAPRGRSQRRALRGDMLQGDAIVLRGTTFCEFGTFQPGHPGRRPPW